MLGEKRSRPLFSAADTAALPQNGAQEEPVANSPRSHDLFFTPENSSAGFAAVLRDVQEYVSSNHPSLITGGGDGARDHIKRYIGKYLQDSRVAVDGMTASELTDALYTEMAEFSFLTKYIYGKGRIEEININSWDDIEVIYSSGDYAKLEERFDSPDHAMNVVRRMLHNEFTNTNYNSKAPHIKKI